MTPSSTTSMSTNNDKSKQTKTSYPCNYKKERGILILQDDKISFIVQIIQTTTQEAKMKILLDIKWSNLKNHQVSPISFPKKLLKLNLIQANSNVKSYTFEFQQRLDLDKIRKDITNRLHLMKQNDTTNSSKRQRTMVNTSNNSATNNFSTLDAQILAVTRSSILATDPTIRAQHKLLVLDDNATLSEDDFWENHKIRLAQEAAKIHGRYRPGMGSMMRSNLDLQSEPVKSGGGNDNKKSGKRCKIRLGVEEMRQIFILYPAVHKAYEEKVPLELSEEQFWRRYLESEYFHRDRGRLGLGVRNLIGQKSTTASSEAKKDDSENTKKEESSINGEKKDNDKEDEKAKQQEDDERGSGAIVKGSEDIFSRYDVEMKQKEKKHVIGNKEGNHLAIGQFDLTSTYNTERSKVGFLPSTTTSDNNDYTTNATSQSDDYPSRVINKYNRHWAMVLNPDDATAGCDLTSVARKSIAHVLPDDNIAKCNGNVDEDFEKLCSFASSDPLDADHVKCVGMDYYNDDTDGGMFTELMIQDKLAYCGESLLGSKNQQRPNNIKNQKEMYERQAVFAKTALANISPYFKISTNNSDDKSSQLQSSLPPSSLGKELLFALTKKMAEHDPNNEYQTYKIIGSLPDSFKKNLYSFFHRTSELLRHFFGLRSIVLDTQNHQDKTALTNKLSKIVSTMEELYREMESMRRELPQTKEGEVMRKMCLPIMGQLDWAFKLNRDGATIGSVGRSGGFVTVEEF